eukprot:TRINITY_DN3945_c0_g1_i1.p1 TRINITY_DN3945_c0_g1~~TRINITY_DN3945_c0_g1_i1.p1  ORF type:complete len:462 (+),score=48.63 TRINITY_DN3945_c0_g1_i1:52-1437(+)
MPGATYHLSETDSGDDLTSTTDAVHIVHGVNDLAGDAEKCEALRTYPCHCDGGKGGRKGSHTERCCGQPGRDKESRLKGGRRSLSRSGSPPSSELGASFRGESHRSHERNGSDSRGNKHERSERAEKEGSRSPSRSHGYQHDKGRQGHHGEKRGSRSPSRSHVHHHERDSHGRHGENGGRGSRSLSHGHHHERDFHGRHSEKEGSRSPSRSHDHHHERDSHGRRGENGGSGSRSRSHGNHYERDFHGRHGEKDGSRSLNRSHDHHHERDFHGRHGENGGSGSRGRSHGHHHERDLHGRHGKEGGSRSPGRSHDHQHKPGFRSHHGKNDTSRLPSREPRAYPGAASVVASLDAYILIVEVPGFAPEEVDVEVAICSQKFLPTVTVKAEQKAALPVEGGLVLYQERAEGPISRRFILPQDAAHAAASVVQQNGLLKLTVPRREPSALSALAALPVTEADIEIV